MSDRDMYFSVDIETDGPLVGIHSMLSLGSVAVDDEGREVSTFSMNLKELDGAIQDPDTMKWWSDKQTAWEAARKNPCDSQEVMERFVMWVKGIATPRNSRPVIVAYPAAFDYSFIRWYLIKFTGNDIFDLSSIDLRSYAMRAAGNDYSHSKILLTSDPKKKNLTHIALNDARDQITLFVKMYKEANLNLPRYHL